MIADQGQVAGSKEAIFSPNIPRPRITGEDSGPIPPFPIRIEGKVEHGFGRGSSELGCPTANLPSKLTELKGLSRNGVYYGWALVQSNSIQELLVKEMVMSVGYNPVYGNQSRTLVCVFLILSFVLLYALYKKPIPPRINLTIILTCGHPTSLLTGSSHHP